MNNWTDVENGTNLIRLVNWSDTLVEPVPDETYNILCAYITFVTVPAIITNGIFICASYKSKKLQEPLHYFLRVMAMIDFCSALFGGSVNIASTAQKGFFLGRTLCHVEGFMIGTFGITNMTSICILSFSRYLTVCKPFGIYTPSKKHATNAFIFALAWALLWNVPQLISGNYDLEGIGTNCGPAWNTENQMGRIYLIGFVICCFFGTVCTLTFCYVQILIKIRSTRKSSSIRSTKTRQSEREVTKMVVYIMVAFFICWTPYTVVALIAISNPGERIHVFVVAVMSLQQLH